MSDEIVKIKKSISETTPEKTFIPSPEKDASKIPLLVQVIEQLNTNGEFDEAKEKVERKDQNDFVNIDPDEILQSLFKFDNRCRPEINALNNKSFNAAIKNNYNLVFDVTGKNFDSHFPNVIQRLKRHRYKVYICIVLNKVNVALTRIKLRQIQTGRHVSEDFTRMVYSKLKKAIPKYIAIGCSDADGNWEKNQ